jgi:O-antigen ligase
MVLAVVLVASWLRQGAITWKRTPLDLPLLAFVGSASISTVFAVNRNVAIFGTYSRWEGLLTITTYALLFWMAVQLISGEGDARWLTWSLLLSSYVTAVVAVLQSWFGVLGAGLFILGNGYIRADATMGQPDFLGIFLAMLLPVSFAYLSKRHSGVTRLLAANLVVVLSLGLLATFTRSAWIGAVVGIAVVVAIRQGRFRVVPLVVLGTLLVIAFGVLAWFVAARPTSEQSGVANVYARIVSIADLSSGTAADRLAVWKDTVQLIAAQPIVGYGPDTFGLVFPQFQSQNPHSAGQLFDKPHEEALGVLATQGIIGFAAYLWILFAFVRAFWAGRLKPGAIAMFAGWVAYQVSMQVDFSYLPTAVPFWLFAAAAVVTWAPNAKPVRVVAFPRRVAIPALAAGSVALAALAIPAIVMPYLADADYYSSQVAPVPQARAQIAQARSFAPYEAAYAIEAGNYALNFDANGNPAPDADWAGAREAFETAAQLGSYSPEMFRDLAAVDEHLGDHAAALAAARRALSLDRYDKDSQALVARLEGNSP